MNSSNVAVGLLEELAKCCMENKSKDDAEYFRQVRSNIFLFWSNVYSGHCTRIYSKGNLCNTFRLS